jgi:hypothetical protein
VVWRSGARRIAKPTRGFCIQPSPSFLLTGNPQALQQWISKEYGEQFNFSASLPWTGFKTETGGSLADHLS